MTRPAGPYPVAATDDVYDYPGKPWDGETNKVAWTDQELAQGNLPSAREPAPKRNWKDNATDRWIQYLDGFEAKNWASYGIVSGTATGSAKFGIGTVRTEIVSNFGRAGYSAGGPGTGFTFDNLGNATFDNAFSGDGSDDGSQGSRLIFPLDNVAHGEMVTGFAVRIQPAVHGALPAHMPKISIRAFDFSGSETNTLPPAATTTKTDPSTPVGTYNAAHTVSVTGTQIPIDRTSYRYFLNVQDEWGANKTNPSIAVLGVSVDIRVTGSVTVPKTAPVIDPGGVYNRKAIVWNPIRARYYAATVRDHQTTVLQSADGRTWVDIDPPTSVLGVATRSTVGLTFTASGSGSVYGGSFYSDGSHVWVLDADHSWSGSGSKGPFQATVYSPGAPDYYGPITAAAGAVTIFLSDHPNVSAVTNASDATPGDDPLGGGESSIAVDDDGGMILNATGDAFFLSGPSASVPDNWSVISSMAAAGQFFCVTWSTDQSAYLMSGKSGSDHPILWHVTSANVEFAVGTANTLPNASAYTTDTSFAAASPSSVVFVSVDIGGGETSVWTGDAVGGTYTEQGVQAFDGNATSLEWAPKDLLFVLTTDTGHVYTSTGGVVWDEPAGDAVADTITYTAIVGGSWLFVATIDGVERLLWTGSQGRTWHQVQSVAPANADLPGVTRSLVALNGRFGLYWIGDGGEAVVFMSAAVFSGG